MINPTTEKRKNDIKEILTERFNNIPLYDKSKRTIEVSITRPFRTRRLVRDDSTESTLSSVEALHVVVRVSTIGYLENKVNKPRKFMSHTKLGGYDLPSLGLLDVPETEQVKNIADHVLNTYFRYDLEGSQE